MRVEDILKEKGREVVTIEAEASLDAAIALLAERNIGAVVVAGEGAGTAPVGILSERDVIRVLAGAPTGYRGSRVEAVMTKDLVTTTLGATLEEVGAVMTGRRIRHLPVLDGERLVGILSIGDVVKHRLEAAKAEADALTGYIRG